MAIALGLAPLLLVEIGLQWADWPRVSERNDPLIGFQDPKPLFQLNETGDLFEVAPERTEFFRPDSFASHKGADEFRIFCLGGSTVQGRPFQIETSFTTWLELSLEAAEPDTTWRVVNCGGVSYASYRLAPILEEVLQYEPDLIILCSGHNEFLEDRTYAKLRDMPAWQQAAHRFASRSKLYQALRMFWLKMSGQSESPQKRELLATEVEARLDYEGGLQLFVRDDAWRSHVMDHYEYNMRRMVQLAKQDEVPLILVNPVDNLRDCGPFKSLPSAETTSEEAATVERLLSEVANLPVSSIDERLTRLNRAVEIDSHVADVYYSLGQTYDAAEDFSEAKRCYELARDHDICPLRMTSQMHAAIKNVARTNDVQWVDANALFASQSPQGITDHTWLLDHVHPTIEGHRLLAAELFAKMVEMRFVQPSDSWETRRDQLYTEHHESLEFAYFEHGQQRLEGLKFWTEGRAHGALPISDKTPIVIED